MRSILNNEKKDPKFRDIILLQLNVGMRTGKVLASTLEYFNEKILLFIYGIHLLEMKKTIRKTAGIFIVVILKVKTV